MSKQVPWVIQVITTLPSGLPRWFSGKESARQCKDVDSIPALGRSLGEENGNLLQCPCMENPMDRGAGQVTVHGGAESDMTEPLSRHAGFLKACAK